MDTSTSLAVHLWPLNDIKRHQTQVNGIQGEAMGSGVERRFRTGREASRGRVRWSGLSLIGSVVLLLAGLSSQVAAATAGAVDDVAAAGPARPEDVVGAAAGAAALALVLWLILAMVTSVVAAVMPRAAPLGRLLAPALLRHLVAALVGAAIVGAATPAGADTGAACPPATADRSTVVAEVDRQVPVAVANRQPAATGDRRPAVVADAVAPAVDPGWRPTVPVTPEPESGLSAGWVPTAPAAQPARRAGADPAIVTASPRRAGVVLDEQVVVRRGDSLWSLSERFLGPSATTAQIAQLWPRWFQANAAVLTGGPDHLVPGMRLTPPEALTGTAGVTTEGDAR
jgi:nucleoid-associated protein YgaU